MQALQLRNDHLPWVVDTVILPWSSKRTVSLDAGCEGGFVSNTLLSPAFFVNATVFPLSGPTESKDPFRFM